MAQTSTRRGIVYPSISGSDAADVPLYIGNLIPALDADVFYIQGTLAARPAASIAGRIYEATDQTPHQFFWDTGSAWTSLGAPPATFGTRAARPAAASNPGGFYYATDQVAAYLSDGTNWYRIGPANAGDIDWTAESSARTGYLICTGQVWPGTTGIYADLFALWGGAYPTNLPDMQARMFTPKGTHADVTTIGFNDGLAVASRRPKHKHAFAGNTVATGTDSVDHTHTVSLPFGGGSTVGNQGTTAIPDRTAYVPGTSGVNTFHTHLVTPTGTVGPQTGAEPTDSSAYIVLQPQVKL